MKKKKKTHVLDINQFYFQPFIIVSVICRFDQFDKCSILIWVFHFLPGVFFPFFFFLFSFINSIFWNKQERRRAGKVIKDYDDNYWMFDCHCAYICVCDCGWLVFVSFEAKQSLHISLWRLPHALESKLVSQSTCLSIHLPFHAVLSCLVVIVGVFSDMNQLLLLLLLLLLLFAVAVALAVAAVDRVVVLAAAAARVVWRSVVTDKKNVNCAHKVSHDPCKCTRCPMILLSEVSHDPS